MNYLTMQKYESNDYSKNCFQVWESQRFVLCLYFCCIIVCCIKVSVLNTLTRIFVKINHISKWTIINFYGIGDFATCGLCYLLFILLFIVPQTIVVHINRHIMIINKHFKLHYDIKHYSTKKKVRRYSNHVVSIIKLSSFYIAIENSIDI